MSQHDGFPRSQPERHFPSGVQGDREPGITGLGLSAAVIAQESRGHVRTIDLDPPRPRLEYLDQEDPPGWDISRSSVPLLVLRWFPHPSGAVASRGSTALVTGVACGRRPAEESFR
ncbi:hypothetical protein ABT255_47675 [Streptomyces mirabilis]|uniref:hypothetical protein n=1 Tax=Streptomyces mirabilis TaxID=68239 RepID=UPI00332781A9